MSMFALRLILRRVDRIAEKIHAHISHSKASLKAEMLMNHDETISALKGMTDSVVALQTRVSATLAAKDQKIADLTAQNQSLAIQLAAAQVTLDVGATTPDEDAAIADVKSSIAALDAAVPAA